MKWDGGAKFDSSFFTWNKTPPLLQLEYVVAKLILVYNLGGTKSSKVTEV